MTLEEAEKLADRYLGQLEFERAHEDYQTYPSIEKCQTFARVLLAVMPVVRAAAAQRDRNDNDPDDVFAAVDVMRRTLGGE